MRSVRCISAQAFQNPATLSELLSAYQPLIVRDFPIQADLYSRTLEIFRRSRLNLFNLLGNTYSETGELRNFSELLEAASRLKAFATQSLNLQAILSEYAELFSKHLIVSEQLNTLADFSVQLDVLPGSEISKTLVLPATQPYAQSLERFTRRSYLNTVLNISRGQGSLQHPSRGIHGHNYDTFTIFGQAGSQTAIYFFPPEFYQRFKARLVSSVPGILLLAPHASTLHDGVLAEAFVHADVQAGDIVYTPPLWFHCFHHHGEYLNIANGEFLPDLHERIMGLHPELFGEDWEQMLLQTQRLQYYSPPLSGQ